MPSLSEITFVSILQGALTLDAFLWIIGVSFGMGFLISLVFILTQNKGRPLTGLSVALVILPPIIAAIILLVGNDIARAFSLAGAFTIIRFRSNPGDPKDISYVFLSLAVGLACGSGQIWFGVTFGLVVLGILLLLYFISYAKPRENKFMLLKVTMPENLNYTDAFEDLLQKYTKMHEMQRIRTRDFGALYQIIYLIELFDKAAIKEFLDALRTRNGNLDIQLMAASLDEDKQ